MPGAALRQAVRSFIDEFSSLWHAADGSRLPDGRIYGPGEQREHEAALSRFVSFLEKRRESGVLHDPEAERDIRRGFSCFFRDGLGFSDAQIELFESCSFFDMGREFRRMARQYDAELTEESIFQAGRNVIIMTGLQRLFGCRIQITPAIFAYSLLYPYSDNVIDDPALTHKDKAEFNARFGRRLAGENVAPCTRIEERVFDLVARIESQYPRERHEPVFHSLRAIHRAQVRSLELMSSDDADRALYILLEKGGTSVIADGYLVAGDLTPPQQRFCFGYGAYLQMLDDLQDIEQDRSEGTATLGVLAARQGVIDDVVCRAIHFGGKVLSSITRTGSDGSALFGELMGQSILALFFEAVRRNRDFYSDTFLKAMDRRSPLRFSVLDQYEDEARRRGWSGSALFFREMEEHQQNGG